MNPPQDKKTGFEELLIRWEGGELSSAETERLIQLLQEDKSARRALVVHFQMNAAIGQRLKTVGDGETSANPVSGRRPGLSWHRWLVPLAAAACLTIVAGVWWFGQRPVAGLGLRVVEVQGMVEGGRGQISDLKSQIVVSSESGVGGQVSGVPASLSHQVTKSKATSHKPLKIGDILRPGDGIDVGADGFAKLAYPDTTQVELQQNTRLRVTLGAGRDKDAKRLALDGGTLVCTAAAQKRPFEIATRHATARVVGTRFRLAAADLKTTLAVLEGKVDLCQGEKIQEVEAGESAEASSAGLVMIGSDKVPSVGGMAVTEDGGGKAWTIDLGGSYHGANSFSTRCLWWNPVEMTLEAAEFVNARGAIRRWRMAEAINEPPRVLAPLAIDSVAGDLTRLGDGRLVGLRAESSRSLRPVEFSPWSRSIGPTVPVPPNEVRGVACDALGRFMMVAEGGEPNRGRVIVWDLERGTVTAELPNLPRATNSIQGQDLGFIACAVAPDAGLAAVADSGGGLLILELPTGTVRHRLTLPQPSDVMRVVAREGFGRELLWEAGELVCHGWPENGKGTIRIAPMAGTVLERLDDYVIRCGKTVIRARTDHVEVAAPGTSVRRIPFPAVPGGVWRWCVSPDGRFLAGTTAESAQILVVLQGKKHKQGETR